MQLIGAHLSAEGSVLYAGQKARQIGLNAVQFFPMTPYVLQKVPWNPSWVEYKETFTDLATVVHGPYVLNLVSDATKVNTPFMVAVFNSYVKAAQDLGACAVVFHVGSNPISFQKGYEVLKVRIEAALKFFGGRFPVEVDLETDCGGGGRIGGLKFLREFSHEFAGTGLKVALDSAHMFSAGVDLRDQSVRDRLSGVLGDIGVVHLNEPDPNVTLGGHLDRHNCKWGQGQIGKEVLSQLALLFRDKVIISETRDQECILENTGILRSLFSE